jgi:hypothetical protein
MMYVADIDTLNSTGIIKKVRIKFVANSFVEADQFADKIVKLMPDSELMVNSVYEVRLRVRALHGESPKHRWSCPVLRTVRRPAS